MAESKHTPGPWAPLRLDIGGRSFWVVISEEGRLPEIEENARLIASAPELYRELRTSRCPRPCNHRPDDFEAGGCVDAGECGCSVGAAIAKAEGRL